ncbi:hypothetical protein FIM04_02245 [SAR202 cluster bacterium AC-409-J13_OGT_754m]|nr:hypothetical protein [SAR202 cluster bacterium AC-409-J13_OGT_754m]
MDITEVLLIIIRWLHAIASATWVGGGIFYVLVLRPSLKQLKSDTMLSIAEDFRTMVTTAMTVLLITGAILTFERLTSGFVGTLYVVTLGTKIALALYMFYLVRFIKTRYRENSYGKLTSLISGPTTVVILGAVIFLLADILNSIFEKGLVS